MVEIDGERVLAASCIRKPAPDMVVKTATDRAKKARRMVMELLLADQPPREESPDRVSPFWHWAEVQGIDGSRFPAHGFWARTFPTRPWLLTSTRASTADSVFARVGRFRSTM